MADSPVTRIVNKFNQLFGIKPSEIPIPKQVGAGVDLDKPLEGATVTTDFLPSKENPMGGLRETETKLGGSKTGKTPYSLAETQSPKFKKFNKEKNLTGQQALDFGEVKPAVEYPENLQKNIRTPLQTKNVSTKFVFPSVANYGIDEYDRYFEDVKKALPDFKDVQALDNYTKNLFATKYENYKKAPKLVSLVDEGIVPKIDEFTEKMEFKQGVKIAPRFKSNIRDIVTQALKKNEGYITKEVTESIDNYITQLVDSVPQKNYNKWAVELIGEVNPRTGKPYTPDNIKKMLSTRMNFALNNWMDKKIKPAMLDQLLKDMAGDFSFTYLEPIVERKMNKLRPKFIAPTVAALVSIVKSGSASELLKAGSGELFGIAGEMILSQDLAPDSEYYTSAEQEEIDKARFIFGNKYANQLKEQIDNQKIKEQNKALEEMGISSL